MIDTEMGTAETCDNCNGDCIVNSELCNICEGTGMIESIKVVKVIKKPYGKCKYPELKLTLTESRNVLIEKENNFTNEKGDFYDRVETIVENVLEKNNNKKKYTNLDELNAMRAGLIR